MRRPDEISASERGNRTEPAFSWRRGRCQRGRGARWGIAWQPIVDLGVPREGARHRREGGARRWCQGRARARSPAGLSENLGKWQPPGGLLMRGRRRRADL